MGNYKRGKLQQMSEKTNRLLPIRRFSIRSMILRATGVLVILEASIVFFIQVVSVIRKRNRQEGSFPHLNMEEGHIRENTVQIYDYGPDLYDTILAVIDSAQKSVYM